MILVKVGCWCSGNAIGPTWAGPQFVSQSTLGTSVPAVQAGQRLRVDGGMNTLLRVFVSLTLSFMEERNCEEKCDFGKKKDS